MTGSLVILSFWGQSGANAPRAAAVPVEGLSIPRVREAPPSRPADVRATEQEVIAVFQGVWLVNPAPDATLVGFHEAAGPGPLPLTPAYVGEDHNAGRPKPPPAGRADHGDVETLILPSRGRSTDATTAIDVAVPDGRPLVSPVTGTVLSVDTFVLYGQHEDHIIRIAPDGRPDLAVELVHLVGPTVGPGERVEAGKTRLAAGAKRFPFSSQIDRFTEERGAGIGPHVHIEVEPVAG